MSKKAFPIPESDTNSAAGTRSGHSAKPPPADLFPIAADVRAKQAEPGSQLTQVPVESIEELDRSQRSLSKVIDLAIAVSDARLETGSAWNSIREILRSHPLSADRAKWEALTENLQAIRPLEPWSSDDSDPSELLARSIERFRRARTLACGKAERIADSLLFGDSTPDEPPSEEVVALRGAIKELQEAANECAKACETASRDLVERIRYRVRVILEQLERQRESVSGQGEGARRRSAVKADPGPGASALNRNPIKTKDGADLEDNQGRSDAPWTGTP